MRPRSAWRAVGACAVLALASVALAATAASRAAPAAVTLDRATVTGAWKEGWLHASLVLGGTTSSAGQLALSVQRTSDGHVIFNKTYAVGAGTYTKKVTLPTRPYPTSYRATATVKSGSTNVGTGTRDFPILPPPEGIVDEAIASAKQGGPRTRAVSAPRRELNARFHFYYPPRAKKVTLVWRTPSYRFVGESLKTSSVTKPYTTTVYTRIRATAPLDRGTWYAFLRVGGKIAKRVSIRIR